MILGQEKRGWAVGKKTNLHNTTLRDPKTALMRRQMARKGRKG